MRQQMSHVRALHSLGGHWATISLAIVSFGSTFGGLPYANTSELSLPRPTVVPSAAIEFGIAPDLNASKQSLSQPTVIPSASLDLNISLGSNTTMQSLSEPTVMPSAAFDLGISPDSNTSMKSLYQPTVMPSAEFSLGVSPDSNTSMQSLFQPTVLPSAAFKVGTSSDSNTSMQPLAQPTEMPSATFDSGSVPKSNTPMPSIYDPTVMPSTAFDSSISPDSNTSMQSLSQPTLMPSTALVFSMPPYAIASNPSVPPQNAMLPTAIEVNFTSPTAAPTSPWSYNPTPSILTGSPVIEHTSLPSYNATSPRSSETESTGHHTEIPTLMPSTHRSAGLPSNGMPLYQTTSIPSMSIQSAAPSRMFASKAPSNYNTTETLYMFQSPSGSPSPRPSSSPSTASPTEPTVTLQKYGPTSTNVSDQSFSRPTIVPSAAYQIGILPDSNSSTQSPSQPTTMPSAALKFSMPPYANTPKPSVIRKTVVPSTSLKVNSTPVTAAPTSPWSYNPTSSILTKPPMNEHTFVPSLNATSAQSSESESNSHHTEIPTLMPSMHRLTSPPSNGRPMHQTTSIPSMSMQSAMPSRIPASSAPSNYNTAEIPHMFQSPSASPSPPDLSRLPSATSPSGPTETWQKYGPTTTNTIEQSLSWPTTMPSAALQSGVLPDSNNSIQPLSHPTVMPSAALEFSMPPYTSTSKPAVPEQTAMPPVAFELNSTSPAAVPTSPLAYKPTHSILIGSPSSEPAIVPSLNAMSARPSESKTNAHHTEVPTLMPSMHRSMGLPSAGTSVYQTTSVPSTSIQSIAPSRMSASISPSNYNKTEKPHIFQSPSGSSSPGPSSSQWTTAPTSGPTVVLQKYGPTTIPPSKGTQTTLPSTHLPAVSPSFTLTYKPSSIPMQPPSRCPGYQPTIYESTQLTYIPSSLPTTRPSALPSGAAPTVIVSETSQPSFGHAAPFTRPTIVDSTASRVPSSHPFSRWPSDVPNLPIPSNLPASAPHINLVSNPSALPLAEPTDGQHKIPSACPMNGPTYTTNPTRTYPSQIIASSSLSLIGLITDIFGLEEARVFRTAVTNSVDIISNVSDVTIISVSAQRRRRRQRHLLNETSALGINFFARLTGTGLSKSQLFEVYISQLTSAVADGQLDMTLQMHAGETHLQGVHLDKTKSMLSIMQDSFWTEVTASPSVSPTGYTPDGAAQPDVYFEPTSEPSALPTATEGKSDGNGHFAEGSVVVFICAGLICGLVCCCGLYWKLRQQWSKQPVRMFPRDEETPDMFNIKANITKLRTPPLNQPTFRSSSFCEELHEAWQEICQSDQHSSLRRARSRRAGGYFVE